MPNAVETPEAVESLPATDPPEVDQPALETLLLDELLVEDVSIDGMCGVY